MKPAFLHSYLLWRSSVNPDEQTLAKFRFTASMALIPAVMVGLFVFGWYAGLILLLSLGSAFITDFLGVRLNGRWIFLNPNGTRDGTWLLSGLLVALLLPPTVPLWVPILGGAFAIAIGKHWISVDGMPLLQPAVVALFALHLLLFPFGHMHPETSVQRQASVTQESDEVIQPGPRKTVFKKNQQAEARIESIKPHQGTQWIVHGKIRNGRPGALSDLTAKIIFRDMAHKVLEQSKWEASAALDSEATVPFTVELPAPQKAVSYEIDIAYSERMPRWPFLNWASAPGKPKSDTGMTTHLIKTYLKGDIRLAIDRQAYFEQLLSGQQPMYDETQQATAFFGPRPIDLIKMYPDRDISELSGKHHYSGFHVFLGGSPGPIGGSSGLALILGALLLLLTRVISWIPALAALGTLAAGLLLSTEPNLGVQLLNGYTLLGIFFLAANPVTVPRSTQGKFMAGVAFGLLELFFRRVGPFSEAIFISVPIVQILSVLIDQKLAPPKEDEERNDVPELGSLSRL